MPNTSRVEHLASISQLHRHCGLEPPGHPLISLVDLSQIQRPNLDKEVWLSRGFYSVAVKRGLKSKLQYGHTSYDFDEGVLALIKPHQVFASTMHPDDRLEGRLLAFSNDLFQGYPLAEKIQSYGYFSYKLNEALHMSQQEEASLISLMHQIESEYMLRIDRLSQDVIVASLDLLLTYVDRYYQRQFITRKTTGNDVIAKLDALLDTYISDGEAYQHGLPSTAVIAEKIALSPGYLNDLVRSLCAQSLSSYIDLAVLQSAKLKLSLTDKSVSTIAYELGFQHSQSFNRFFKKYEQRSPGEYRKRLM